MIDQNSYLSQFLNYFSLHIIVLFLHLHLYRLHNLAATSLVYPTNTTEILKRLILQEESSIGQISLLQLERGAGDREQRGLHAHTRHGALVESLEALGLEDLHEHIEELHLHLVALLGLHARLDHVHWRHQARSEAASNHTRSQQTAKRHVAVLVAQRDLDGRVEREEDHGVRDITKKRNRGALVHATQTQVTAH